MEFSPLHKSAPRAARVIKNSMNCSHSLMPFETDAQGKGSWQSERFKRGSRIYDQSGDGHHCCEKAR
jgi:hypothetical protein